MYAEKKKIFEILKIEINKNYLLKNFKLLIEFFKNFQKKKVQALSKFLNSRIFSHCQLILFFGIFFQICGINIKNVHTGTFLS